MIITTAVRRGSRCQLCDGNEPAKIEITGVKTIFIGRACLDELLVFAKLALKPKRRR